MTTRVIFGPPGTGKTTYLINAVQLELASGLAPEDIAFVSFTKAAVNEAVGRAVAKFQYTKNQFRWFRTLHSMCFAALRMDREAMLTDYSAFANISGLRFSKAFGEDRMRAGACEGDQFLAGRSLCSATGLPYATIKQRYNLALGGFRYERLSAMLTGYKKELKVNEYHDLLERYLRECNPLPVKVAFVDEAQDLTPTQWKVVQLAFRNVERLYIAGDDDQAIYEWAGAEPLRMIATEGERIILSRSFRLAPEHVALAQFISTRIKRRQPKEWGSADPKKQGRVYQWWNWRDIDFNGGASWMVLARANQFLPELATLLEQHGLAYNWCGAPRIKPAQAFLFAALRELLDGKPVRGGTVIRLMEESGNIRSISVRSNEMVNINAHGLRDVNWLSKWPRQRVQYFERVQQRYGKVVGVPSSIELTTIHQAKGSEADNVVLCPDVTPSTWSNINDAEHRVWYVAVSRTKQRLFLLRPSHEHFYRVP